MLDPTLQEHFDNPYHRGECPAATHSAEVTDPNSDCVLLIELQAAGDVIVEGWFDGRGCACCEGLASLLMERIEGQTFEEAASVSLAELLKLDGVADAGKLPDCHGLPCEALRAALHTPLDPVDPPSGFSGPSLREEC